MKNYKITKPFILTIFGASGNLAKIKFFPSLYYLMKANKLPKEFYIIGFARTKKTREEFQKDFIQHVKENIKEEIDQKILDKLTKHLFYFTGQYKEIEDFKSYRKHIKTITKKTSLTNLAYFAIPPILYKDVIQNLGKTKFKENEDTRLIIEKPFGTDNKSAKELFHFVALYFDEKNVYLLDHYLGKTAVQSILNLRHSNRLINLMLKAPIVSNIQITAFEELGVDKRAGYFNSTGIIKDMIQSHLLQLLALITMSIPISDDASSLHREKYNILSALKFIDSDKNIVLGQYEGYLKEENVPKNSKTETFSAIRLFIDRESWYKTPIYIRTGKKINKKHTYIVVEIEKFAFQSKEEDPNLIIIELQPNEKINIRLINKSRTGNHKALMTSQSIKCEDKNCLPEHCLLLLEVMQGHCLHFTSFPETITAWRITDQITKFIKDKKIKVEKYKTGTKGPKSQHKLTKLDGFKWHDLD